MKLKKKLIMDDIFETEKEVPFEKQLADVKDEEVCVGWWVPHVFSVKRWRDVVARNGTKKKQNSALIGLRGKMYDTERRANFYNHHKKGAIPVYAKKTDLLQSEKEQS